MQKSTDQTPTDELIRQYLEKGGEVKQLPPGHAVGELTWEMFSKSEVTKRK